MEDDFSRLTGLETSRSEMNKVWSQLSTMGTTAFSGGKIGSFQLDEASLLAGAMSIGATEFDKFLRTGSLSFPSSELGKELSSIMSNAVGLDISAVAGRFTTGGGSTNFGDGSYSRISNNQSPATQNTDPSCDPGVAQQLSDLSQKHVDQIVTAAQSSQVGFSKISAMKTSKGSGFAANGCLDKLFTMPSIDVLFKPPSITSLANTMQNWTCNDAVTVAQQVASSALPNMSGAGIGGYDPFKGFAAQTGSADQLLSIANLDVLKPSELADAVSSFSLSDLF
ncbi:hypothetical protein [Flexibacterium corallicola]|uniref:hypothetical protein n=1 Tax=Flexibacterium corallicola TaxID=3037259 RepID=UPI00286FA451|nr:hypothetical protein [Pseudovibrio sp. M1P-2-3]